MNERPKSRRLLSIPLLFVVTLVACGHERQEPKPLLGMKSDELVAAFKAACTGRLQIADGGLHCGLAGLRAYFVGFDEHGRIRRMTIDFHDSNDDLVKTFDTGLSTLFPEPTRTKLRDSIAATSTRVPIDGGAIRVVRTTTDQEGRAYESIMWAD